MLRKGVCRYPTPACLTKNVIFNHEDIEQPFIRIYDYALDAEKLFTVGINECETFSQKEE